MGFSFYPARHQFNRLTIHLRSRQSDYLRSFKIIIISFIHSFDVGKLNHMDNTILDWFTDGNLPPSRFMDVFLSSTFQLFFSPHLLAITFQFSTIPHGRQTPPFQTFVDAMALHLPAPIRRR